MKDLYNYNYLKTYKTIEKWYRKKDSKIYYASYLMIGKISIAFIYPFERLLRFLNLSELFTKNSKLYFLMFAIIFFTLDYFLIRKQFEKIVEKFENKSDQQISTLKFWDYLIKFGIIILNISLIFWI